MENNTFYIVDFQIIEKTMKTETNKEEFEKIFIRFFPKVKMFAAVLLRSEQEAEDVAQDIFVKLWEHPDLWEGDLIRNYLFVMVKNHIFNRIKRKSLETKYIDSQINLQGLKEIAEFKDPLHRIYHEELQLLLNLSLKQMPEKRRKVFEMSRFQHLSNLEIASKMHLSVRTVEQHIYLALKALKKNLIYYFF